MLTVLLAAAAYFAAARLGQRLALVKGVTPLWAPTGIALVAFLVLARDDLERQLATGLVITVPTKPLKAMPMVHHIRRPVPTPRRSGRYEHRIIEGVGHNLPQEGPAAFAEAVFEVDTY